MHRCIIYNIRRIQENPKYLTKAMFDPDENLSRFYIQYSYFFLMCPIFGQMIYFFFILSIILEKYT